jgi:hypothetical protein
VAKENVRENRTDHFPFLIFHFSFVIDGELLAWVVSKSSMKNDKWKMTNGKSRVLTTR